MTITTYGERCDKCGEAYTPFTLRSSARSGGRFVTQQCNCYAFGGEPDVPVLLLDPVTGRATAVDEVPLLD